MIFITLLEYDYTLKIAIEVKTMCDFLTTS